MTIAPEPDDGTASHTTPERFALDVGLASGSRRRLPLCVTEVDRRVDGVHQLFPSVMVSDVTCTGWPETMDSVVRLRSLPLVPQSPSHTKVPVLSTR